MNQNDQFNKNRKNILEVTEGIINKVDEAQEVAIINTQGEIVTFSSNSQDTVILRGEKITRIAKNIFLFKEQDFNHILLRGEQHYVIIVSIDERFAIIVLLSNPKINGRILLEIKRQIQIIRQFI